MNSTYKNCPDCGSNQVIKNGSQYGRKRYKCKNCSRQFQNKKVISRKVSAIINQLTFKKTILI
jgi:transposase-like protein